MKIVHLCNYIQPALGYQEYYLAREHAKAGHQVTVITSDRFYPFPDYKKTVGKVLGKRIIGKKTEKIEGFEIIRLNVLIEVGTQVWLLGLSSAIKKIKPDVVICHEMIYFNAKRIAKLKKKINFRLIYDSHASLVCDTQNPLKQIFYKMQNYSVIKDNADKIIGVTDECVNYIVKKFKIPKKIPVMIPLGADTDIFFKDNKKGLEIRKKYGIKKNDFVIIYTGKMLEAKGVKLIIEAAAEIKNNKNIVIMAVGDGNIEYIEKMKKFSLEKKVNFIKIDAVPNKALPAFYSAASIGCWPVQATIGTIEAIACGLPIICVMFLNERYEAGNGFGIKEWDLKGLKEKINFFIKNPAMTKKMSMLSLKAAKERFSWSAIAEKFLE